MASAREPHRGDPHDWNSLENYVLVHKKRLSEHALVVQEVSSLLFLSEPAPHTRYDVFKVQGLIVCRNGICLTVSKRGDMERSHSRRVRMFLYAYNAWFPGGHNVLRYDNQHVGQENVYHRHQFDPVTGVEVGFSRMQRHQFPVMHEILDELMALFPPQL